MRDTNSVITKNLASGLTVFLVAIPMSMGIALASGLPVLSGLVAAVIGGIIIGAISGSPVSVSGPAAGLIVVTVSSLQSLGDTNTFFLALFLSGVIQILMGSLRMGFLSDFIPTTVIQGMMCAIGLLLIINQLPYALLDASSAGHLSSTTHGLFSLMSPSVYITHLNYGATIIFLLTLSILAWFKLEHRVFNYLPIPFLAVALAVGLNEFFIHYVPSFAQHTNLGLDKIFDVQKGRTFIENSFMPNWDALLSMKVYICALLLAVVSSFESIANMKAIERINNYKSRCSKNRELIAQGVGNLACGIFGGLPVSALIARSTLNVKTGASSRISTISHGFFILILLATMPTVLNKIPPSCLAAILIYVGYKLTSPSVYISVYRQGRERFFSFLVSLIAIVALGLWNGLLIGVAISLFYILKSNSRVRLNVYKEQHPSGETHRIVLPQQTTFLHKAAIVSELEELPSGSNLVIDAHYSTYIDSEILLFIKDFCDQESKARDISLNLFGFKENYVINDQIHFINVPSHDVQSSLNPSDVLNIIQQGNKRFREGNTLHRNVKADIEFTQDQQHPIAIVLGCIDSRVPVETVFDMSFGDLFCARVAGNIVNTGIIGSMEYACKVAGAKLIVVLGHYQCGAIKSACDAVELGQITKLLKKVDPAIHAETETKENRGSGNDQFVKNVTHLNVANTIKEIYQSSDILRQMIDDNELGIVGAVYDVASGKVLFSNYMDDLNQIISATNTSEDFSKLSASLKALIPST